jgi:hypothetical protein
MKETDFAKLLLLDKMRDEKPYLSLIEQCTTSFKN